MNSFHSLMGGGWEASLCPPHTALLGQLESPIQNNGEGLRTLALQRRLVSKTTVRRLKRVNSSEVVRVSVPRKLARSLNVRLALCAQNRESVAGARYLLGGLVALLSCI